MAVVHYPSKVKFNNCTFENSRFDDLLCVCNNNSKFDDCSFYYSVIFSDDYITIINSRFSGVHDTKYYPNSLYLTGEFECKNNSFNLNKSIRGDFDFNFACIKTIPETDINEFIRLNTFNIEMIVNHEFYHGLFYSLIDDSKLHYKEIF